MENLEIANRLEELADLLEIQGANPFRIRAYRNAVRLLRGLTRSVEEMVREDEDLTELPGIGSDLASQIGELLETGEVARLAEVTREVPRELAVLTRLEGLGPKKVRRIWEELGITTVEALEEAIRDGRVAALEGFGARSAEKTLEAIDRFRRHRGRFLRSEAEAYLRPLRARLEASPAVARLEVAGSFRRGCETVGDLDLLVVPADRKGAATEVLECFTGFEGVERVEAAGDTRSRVLLRSGLPVDLRILPAAVQGAALHHFTGSKEHNVRIRGLARERGLRISEYGVFRATDAEAGPGAGEGSRGGEREDASPRAPGADERPIAGRTEEEVFAAVGLPWIPPVLREGRGEIEAAREGRLPRLVEEGDLRGNLHMHSTWSDGKDSIADMARACRARGYAYLAITDHSQSTTVANGLTAERLEAQAEEVARVREEVEGIHLFHGCEVDILKDGSLDLPDEVLARLDLVLVAVHSHFHLEAAAQTERVIRALAHPLADILVHPTGRLLQRRDPIALDMDAVLEAAREHDVAVEVNANPRRLDLHDRHLFRARELGVLVSIGTDAHQAARLDQMAHGVLQAQRGWLEPAQVLNTRTWAEMRRWLDRKRGE